MADPRHNPLQEYTRRRDFNASSEPRADGPHRRARSDELCFVVQKHDARRLHYDFRLELDGTLKSWAVPKGPSLDPREKRLAVQVEDHPIAYADFEGSIPHGHYGAGDVIIWDRGTWQPHGDPRAGYQKGKLSFTLHGEKLAGDWHLVRTHLKGSGDKPQWLLIKEEDGSARPAEQYTVVEAEPASVVSGTRLAADADRPAPATAKRTPRRTRRQPAARDGDAIPDLLAPELATLVKEPPQGDWLYEIKFDGYRLLARIRGGEVRLFTRNGNDWSARLPQQVDAIASLGLADTWLDGEIVVLNAKGAPDFQALQRAFDAQRSADIVYYLFDLPYCEGRDLRALPVERRRDELLRLLGKKRIGPLRYSEALDAEDYRELLRNACAMSLEGVIGKRLGSPYAGRRTADWIKLKCRLRQEFVIAGYSHPKGSCSGFGALLLAVNENGALRYAGRVGTGFNQADLRSLHARLRRLERKRPPVTAMPPGAQTRDVHWVDPKLVCEVEFAEWTQDGLVRQAAFLALRTDKPPEEIVREIPREVDAKKPARPPVARGGGKRGSATVAGVAISNPHRLIDADSGAHKIDLARFYADIADWILPQLKQRPVSLLRAPEGIDGEQFFQKHAERLAIPHITHLDRALDPGHAPLMQIDSLPALIGVAQMGTVELHTWVATSDRIETPDRFVLDLDPDPKLPWRKMIEATQLVLSVLDELGLEALLKTSGGKGMHVVVPLARRAGWEEVKAFARAISVFMTRQLPERFTATMGPQNRIGKIFIDYLRNQRGASTVSAYSVRARPGLPVSVPIAHDELAALESARQWTMANLRERLDGLKQDPWAAPNSRQRLTRAQWKKLDAEKP